MTRKEELEDRIPRFNELYTPITESGCWIWIGATDAKGYGLFTVHQRSMRAHRFSFEIHNGEIPEGFHVCHSCDIPSCVNPSHLWLGTALENNRDIHNKGRFVQWQRAKTHCKNGHELIGDNVRIKNGCQRECMVCKRENWRKWVDIRIETRNIRRQQQDGL